MQLVARPRSGHLPHWLGSAAGRLGADARRAGPEAPVPTCPGWTVRDLLVHQGMVHAGPRRTLGDLRRRPAGGAGRRRGWPAGPRRPATPPPTSCLVRSDPPHWPRRWRARRRSGRHRLLPRHSAPREFWARRQAPKPPSTPSTPWRQCSAGPRWRPSPGSARRRLLGVVELLCGFLPPQDTAAHGTAGAGAHQAPSRSRTGLRLGAVGMECAAGPGTSPHGTGRGRPRPGRCRHQRCARRAVPGSWNRGGKLEATGDAGVLQLWRQQMWVSWS